MFEWFYKQKIITMVQIGFLIIALMSLSMVSMSIWKTKSAKEANERVANLHVPTSQSSLMILSGMNHSLAALRGWMILSQEHFRVERFSAWNNEIEPSLKKLKELSKSWTSPENIKKLSEISQQLIMFKQYQKDIEDITPTLDNLPANKILLEDAIPKANIMLNALNKIIDLEISLPAQKKRKILLGVMANLRDATTRSLAELRGYLLSADSELKIAFSEAWQSSTQAFNRLKSKIALLTSEQKEFLSEFISMRDTFEPLTVKMLAIRSSKQWNQANFWLASKASPRGFAIEKKLLELIENQNSLFKVDVEASKNDSDQLISTLWVMLFMIMILIIAFGKVISTAVKKVLKELDQVVKDSEATQWVQRGVEQLNVEVLGLNTILEVSDKSLRQISNYINAGSASVYHFNKDTEVLSRVAEYAFVKTEGDKDTFKLGEGVIGQVALQKKSIHLKERDDKGLIIETGHSSEIALHSYTMPLLDQDKILGVIELAANNAFDERLLDFLDSANAILAKALGTAEQNENVKALLSQAEHNNIALSQQKNALDSHSIVGITDVKGTITYANSKFSEVSGYSNEELVGANHRIVNSGTYDDSFWSDMYNTVSSGKIWHHPAIKNRAKNGSIYWVDTTIFPFMGANGKPESYIAIRTDVTNNKIIEDALAQRQNAVDAHSIVGITDIKGTITYANSKFTEVSGYSQSELIGANHRLVNSGEYTEGFWKEMYKTISQGKIWHHPAIKNRAKDGSTYWVDTTIFPFMDANGKPESYIAIRTDVTNNKIIEQKLLDAKEEAEQAVVAKANFLASMSHEIRTPMNGVIGMLGLLSREELTKRQAENVSIASASATSLLSVINDILDFSKLEAGKVELETIEFDVKKEIESFGKSIAVTIHGSDVELLLDLSGITQPIILSDMGRLKQILNNLVGNAIKFTHKGNIIIRAAMEDRENSTSKLSISIEDSGIGIPEDKISMLFHAFTQADSSTTRKYGGTGLGLSIAKNLVEIMGGELSVSSEPDKGSVFSFFIEVERSNSQPASMPIVDIRGKKILIVDDNAINIDILKRQLELWDSEVTVAMSAKEALDICSKRAKENFFDFAILDMQMPDMNGEVLGEKLSLMPETQDMKMIMMTSYGEHKNIDKLYDKGFHAFFMKPTTVSDLYNALLVLTDNENTPSKGKSILTKSKLNALLPSEVEANKNVNILLVEDNITNQIVAQGMLDSIGLKADVANNGQEALDILNNSKTKYNIILMDCQMPILDGFETTKAIRNHKCGDAYRDIHIIAMTANAMAGDKEKCLDAGMNDYISKPLIPEVFKEVLYKGVKFAMSEK